MQLLRNRLVSTARQSMRKNSSLGQLYGNMQEAYNQMQTPLIYQQSSDLVRHNIIVITTMVFLVSFPQQNKIIIVISFVIHGGTTLSKKFQQACLGL